MAPESFCVGRFRSRRKIAVFDYDWTLVKPSSGYIHARGETDVEWFNEYVVERLRELYSLGFAMIVLTNQNKGWARAQISTWLGKTKLPFLVGMAKQPADKKPSTVLFDTTVTWEWDRRKSFYVGDALGRPGDWSASDRDFARSVGLVVHAPEEIFNACYPVLSVQPLCAQQEIVVMVGYPGSGKSTMVRNLFTPNGYAVVSGAKPQEKALAALKAGAAVVVDATNPSRRHRARYTSLACSRKLPIRCVYFATQRALAMDRNTRRVDPIPVVVYNVYDEQFEMPSTDEGFKEVVVLPHRC